MDGGGLENIDHSFFFFSFFFLLILGGFLSGFFFWNLFHWNVTEKKRKEKISRRSIRYIAIFLFMVLDLKASTVLTRKVMEKRYRAAPIG